jgi:ubiquinone/menaquinone biosynthesis C-methylase UbiE
MFIRLAFALMQFSPSLKKFIWKCWYQYIAGYRNADWGFMNYGYAPTTGEAKAIQLKPLELKPEDEPNRFSIQLYHRVATAVSVAGKRVLEVGSGRGGGASFVARYLEPLSMTGGDYSAKAVRFCNGRHKVNGLKFVQADAESLPFDANSFDVVINVESSHCYGSMPKFLAEVKRVLTPGGHFSFVDLRGADDEAKLHSQMLESGMELIEHEDITPQVLKALRLDSDKKLALIEKTIGKTLLPTFLQFAGIEGSQTYENFRTRRYVYVRYLLKKQNESTT